MCWPSAADSLSGKPGTCGRNGETFSRPILTTARCCRSIPYRSRHWHGPPARWSPALMFHRSPPKFLPATEGGCYMRLPCHLTKDRRGSASGTGPAPRRRQGLLDKVTQQPDFAAGHLSGRDIGDGVSAGERPDERGAMRDHGTDGLAETCQLLRKLAALGRAGIDPIWHQDHVGTSVAPRPNRIDDFQCPHGRLDVESRGRTWHQHEIGNCNCGAEGTVAGSCIDHNIVGRSLSDVANPILDGLIRKC